jgi:hypothetical protein
MSIAEPLIQDRIRSILSLWESAIQPVVEELISKGFIPKVSFKKACEALLSYMEGMTLMAKVQNDPKVFRR